MSFPGFVIVPDDEDAGADNLSVMTAVLDDQGKPKIVELADAGNYRQIEEGAPVSAIKKTVSSKKKTSATEKPEKSKVTVTRKKKSTNPVSYRYKCDKCSRMFAMPSQLRSHRKRVHHVEAVKPDEGKPSFPQPARTHPCFMCPSIFSQRAEFEEHMLSAHNVQVPAQPLPQESPQKAPRRKLCEIEAKRIQKLESLVVQDPFVANQIAQELECLKKPPPKRRPYKAVRKHICPICKKGFPTPSLLERHKFVHTRERLYPCPHCPKRLAYTDERLRHIRRCHPEFASWTEEAKAKARAQAEVIFTCKICGDRTFHSRYRYREHLRVHLGVLYECHLCDKKYGKRDQLMRHIMSHSQERNFRCDICPKRFIDAVALKTHKRVHSKEFYHKCPICEKAFAKKKDLYNHISKHNEENADDGLQCSICWDRFEDKESLLEHKSLHVTENTPKVHQPKLQPDPQQQLESPTAVPEIQHSQGAPSDSTWSQPVAQSFQSPMISMQDQVPIPPILANINQLYHCSFCKKAFSSYEESQLHARLHEPVPITQTHSYTSSFPINYSEHQDPSHLQHYPDGSGMQHSRLLL